MANEALARRYASALADVVLKSGETETVKTELAVWAHLFVGSEDLHNVLGNPAIPQKGKERVLEQLLGKMKPSTSSESCCKTAGLDSWLRSTSGLPRFSPSEAASSMPR